MEVIFDDLPGRSRVWVYQANRPLSQSECNALTQQAQAFVGDWAAHGKPLKGSAKIFHGRFLVIAVDEAHNVPTGCAIDSSVHFVQELEKTFGVGFFDRTQVAFMDGQTVQVVPMGQIKQKVANGEIGPETPTFNNLVDNKLALEESWLEKAENTWLKRYF